MNNLFYSKTEQLYYFNDCGKECDNCNTIVEDIIFIRAVWDKLGSGISYFCFNCRGKSYSLATVINNISAVVCDDLPTDSVPVILSKPIITNTTNMSTCDIANINISSEQTIDKTVYANKENLDDIIIGNKELINTLAVEDNKLLSVDEGLNLLNELAKAKPLIEKDTQDEYLLR